jgi:hypothetical protein
MRRHFCQHPLLPERDGTTRTAREIRDQAVHEIYKYCEIRGLCEVWGYLWTNWYAPDRWKLWALSAPAPGSKDIRISRLRTTMMVEVFWRVIKHLKLQTLVRPRLDQLVYILIHEVTKEALVRLRKLDPDYRAGRSKALSSYQLSVKKEWKKYEVRKITHQYTTDIHSFTCTCGHQKYSSALLCKHLVQLLPPSRALPPDFWLHIYRRRTLPLYRAPAAFIEGDGQNLELDAIDPGYITDGDDHVWMGDKRILCDFSKLKNLQNLASSLGKRVRSVDDDGDVERDRAQPPGPLLTSSTLDDINVDQDLVRFDIMNTESTSSVPVTFGVEHETEVRLSCLFSMASTDDNLPFFNSSMNCESINRAAGPP